MNKYAILLAAMLAASSGLMAQIPNAGFENWTTTGNFMNPAGWYSINNWIDSLGSYFPITRSTDHYPASTGSYSMRLESNPVQTAPASWAIAMTAGNSDRPLFPLAGHPDTLCGYYKYLPQGDTLDIHWHVYQDGNEVAMGRWMSGSAASQWARFAIPISFYNNGDSARITISATTEGPGKTMSVYGNSLLFIDDLSLVTSNFSVENAPASSMTPDVAVAGSGVLNYRLPAAASVSVRILDLRGRLVYADLNRSRSSGSYSMPFLLPSGAYALGFDAGGIHVRKSFVVMH